MFHLQIEKGSRGLRLIEKHNLYNFLYQPGSMTPPWPSLLMLCNMCRLLLEACRKSLALQRNLHHCKARLCRCI